MKHSNNTKEKNTNTSTSKHICLMSWQTYIKKYNPQKYYSPDGVKGWVRSIVRPTLITDDFFLVGEKYDYDLFENEKPKTMALRLIDENPYYRNAEDFEFVYAPYYYNGGNCLMDSLYVYARKLNKNS